MPQTDFVRTISLGVNHSDSSTGMFIGPSTTSNVNCTPSKTTDRQSTDDFFGSSDDMSYRSIHIRPCLRQESSNHHHLPESPHESTRRFAALLMHSTPPMEDDDGGGFIPSSDSTVCGHFSSPIEGLSEHPILEHTCRNHIHPCIALRNIHTTKLWHHQSPPHTLGPSSCSDDCDSSLLEDDYHLDRTPRPPSPPLSPQIISIPSFPAIPDMPRLWSASNLDIAELDTIEERCMSPGGLTSRPFARGRSSSNILTRHPSAEISQPNSAIILDRGLSLLSVASNEFTIPTISTGIDPNSLILKNVPLNDIPASRHVDDIPDHPHHEFSVSQTCEELGSSNPGPSWWAEDSDYSGSVASSRRSSSESGLLMESCVLLSRFQGPSPNKRGDNVHMNSIVTVLEYEKTSDDLLCENIEFIQRPLDECLIFEHADDCNVIEASLWQ